MRPTSTPIPIPIRTPTASTTATATASASGYCYRYRCCDRYPYPNPTPETAMLVCSRGSYSDATIILRTPMLGLILTQARNPQGHSQRTGAAESTSSGAGSMGQAYSLRPSLRPSIRPSPNPNPVRQDQGPPEHAEAYLARGRDLTGK